MREFHVDSVVFLWVLRFKGEPVLLHLNETCLCFGEGELLHELIATEHVASNAGVGGKVLVVALHLLEICSIRISNKVQSVASRRFIPQNDIPFIVFKHEMRVQFALRITITLCGPFQILLASLLTIGNGALIEVTALRSYVYLAFLFLANVCKDRGMPAQLICVLYLRQFGKEQFKYLFRVSYPLCIDTLREVIEKSLSELFQVSNPLMYLRSQFNPVEYCLQLILYHVEHIDCLEAYVHASGVARPDGAIGLHPDRALFSRIL
ncbi:hypothetical protein FGO68_gene17535 [Halteria grandinella]|uniref:Uncharacterized protein n=1 Tax=Halteria grandinella TaxID=5974 RepID=A0A8J8NAA6_HALGN|nr:hypothetical protein FGO68_gene17535 [Halteria grandinella]